MAVSQNANGPCSLLALSNILILRGSIHIPPSPRHPTHSPLYITYSTLSSLIGDFLITRPNLGGGRGLSVSAALEILPSTVKGLDVNVGFDGIGSFEPIHRDGNGSNGGDGGELALFEFCGVDLVHGWVVDESSPSEYNALQRAVGNTGNDAASGNRKKKVPTYDALQEAIVNGMIAESKKGGEGGLNEAEWQAAEDGTSASLFFQGKRPGLRNVKLTSHYVHLFLHSSHPTTFLGRFRHSNDLPRSLRALIPAPRYSLRLLPQLPPVCSLLPPSPSPHLRSLIHRIHLLRRDQTFPTRHRCQFRSRA